MSKLEEKDTGPRPIAEPIQKILLEAHLHILAIATDETLRDEASAYLRNQCGLTAHQIADLLEKMDVASA